MPGRGEYQWNGNNRLIQFTNQAGVATHYQYDAQGRRIEKRTMPSRDSSIPISKPTATKCIWDNWTLLADYSYDNDNVMVDGKHYTWG